MELFAKLGQLLAPTKFRKADKSLLDTYQHIEELQTKDWCYSVWFTFSYELDEWDEELPDGRTYPCSTVNVKEIKVKQLMGCHESEEELMPMREISGEKYAELIAAIECEIMNTPYKFGIE